MDSTLLNRPTRLLRASLGVIMALLMCSATVGVAHAAEAAPAGDVVAIGDPDARGQVDLYVDPLCPYSGQMVRERGDEIGKRIEDGALRVNLRYVDFLDKYSASGTYDSRAVYATYVVSDQTKSSTATWNFVRQIYSQDHQPKEKGTTDLGNDELADLAGRVGAPQLAQDLIRIGLPIGYDPRAIAAHNLVLLHAFPEPGVPLVVIDDQPLDGQSDWLTRLPR